MYMTIGHRNRKAPQFPVRVGSMAHIAFRRIGYRAPYLFSRCKTVYESLFIGDSAENKIRDVLVADCDLLLPGGCRHGVDAPQPIGESTRSTTGMGCPPGRRSRFASARMCALRTMSFRRKGRMCVRW